MTRKPERDWGTRKTALGAFRTVEDGLEPVARMAPMFVHRLFDVSGCYRVGKGPDTLLIDTAREVVRFFRTPFEQTEAFKLQSYTVAWDREAYQLVEREFVAEMSNSVAIADVVKRRLEDERRELFSNDDVTHRDPAFFIARSRLVDVLAPDDPFRSDPRYEETVSEPLSRTFNRTLDVIEERNSPAMLAELKRQVIALARVGQALFGGHY